MFFLWLSGLRWLAVNRVQHSNHFSFIYFTEVTLLVYHLRLRWFSCWKSLNNSLESCSKLWSQLPIVYQEWNYENLAIHSKHKIWISNYKQLDSNWRIDKKANVHQSLFLASSTSVTSHQLDSQSIWKSQHRNTCRCMLKKSIKSKYMQRFDWWNEWCEAIVECDWCNEKHNASIALFSGDSPFWLKSQSSSTHWKPWDIALDESLVTNNYYVLENYLKCGLKWHWCSTTALFEKPVAILRVDLANHITVV